MIIVVGGTKGGVGKTTIATNLTVLRSLEPKAGGQRYEVMLVDADEQGSASDFVLQRNELLGRAGFTAVQLYGAAVRSEVLNLKEKYDDIVIDVGGRDTGSQRAALLVGDVYLVPFLPGSYDVWTLAPFSELVREARVINPDLVAYCVLNKADARGSENQQAADLAKQEAPELQYVDLPIVNRRAFRNTGGEGLAVSELKAKDKKAIAEMTALYRYVFGVTEAPKGNRKGIKAKSK